MLDLDINYISINMIQSHHDMNTSTTDEKVEVGGNKYDTFSPRHEHLNKG